jgi:hypothetical protein
MAVQNFKLVSEFQTIHRRPFGLHDPTILNPVATNPLLDGEFLELGSDYLMARGSANPAVVPSFAYFAERGRYEVQALGKGPFLYLGPYEADTLIFLGTGITTVGQKLEVANVTIGGLTRRGLVIYTNGTVVGRVTRLPANNKNFLRFIHEGCTGHD